MNTQPFQIVRRRPWVFVAYILLLIVSKTVQITLERGGQPVPGIGQRTVTLPAFNKKGPVAGKSTRIAYREWAPPGAEEAEPIILLHGWPGDSSYFSTLGPLLALGGHRVIAPDQPGFGASQRRPPDRSLPALAQSTLALMDELKIGRAHVVGYSSGGGVALRMCAAAPERIATLTLLSSIGAQENEGSGSYNFEHFKYAVGIAVVGGGGELVPHFGLLGSYNSRASWLRAFLDMDQRPLRGIMERVTAPTLIIHGRHDILVPAYAAEDHHRIIKTSRLVMLDATHFIPITCPEEAADEMLPFFHRHETAGEIALTDMVDLAPRPPRRGFDALLEAVRETVREAPWWAEAGVIAALTLVSPGWTVVIVGLVIVGIDLDYGVALLGIVCGFMFQSAGLLLLARVRGWRARDMPLIGRNLPTPSASDWQRRMLTHPAREGFQSQFVAKLRTPASLGAGLARAGWVRVLKFLSSRLAATILWGIVSLITVATAESLLVGEIRRKLGLIGVGYTLIKLIIIAEIAPMLVTRRSRQHLRALIGRILHHEYWPAWALYIPLLPHIALLALRNRGLMTPTCLNPEIENGGGVIAESKSAVMKVLRARCPEALPTHLIAAAPDARARAEAVYALMAAHRELAEFPLSIKPDRGQHGHAVRLVRTRADVQAYFEMMTADAIVQPYHPGPRECGVLWAREIGRETGRIFSVARMEFPVIVGDGERTLEDLIHSHPRYRQQAAVFLDRFADSASRIPAEGEEVRLAMSGNHSQGTLFRDAAELVTPEFEAAVARLAAAIPRFDFGRFDIRYESDELLKRGEKFAVVELNGSSSESTNIYDPARSPRFAYRVLFAQWRLMYRLGAERRAQGVKPMGWWQLIALVRRAKRELRGSAVAD